MMLYQIETMCGVIIAEDIDQNAPSIRLQEGKVLDGEKRPLDLGLHEQTRVRYPLLGGSLETIVTRTE